MAPRMKKKSRLYPRIIALIALFAHPLFSQQAGEATAVILVNPGSPRAEDCMRGWQLSYGRRHLYDWGRSRGLDIVEDREPVVDNVAAYVSPYGSKIVVPGLTRGKRYRIWIDFVRFRGDGEFPPCMVRITAAGPGGVSIHLADIRPGDLGEGYYYLDLPLESTIRGGAEISFTEYTPRPGCWGVWDIIIGEGDTLPGRGAIPADGVIDLDIKERIVE